MIYHQLRTRLLSPQKSGYRGSYHHHHFLSCATPHYPTGACLSIKFWGNEAVSTTVQLCLFLIFPLCVVVLCPFLSVPQCFGVDCGSTTLNCGGASQRKQSTRTN